MAIRKIRLVPDEILRKKSRSVEVVDKKIQDLVEDMLEAMYRSEGIGMAAVQVGVLRRVVVMDVSEERNRPIVIINPEILHSEGSQVHQEACLSIPDLSGTVERPYLTIVKGLDRNGEPQELRCEGDLSIVVNHEIDHLDGILYTDKATEFFSTEDDED
ncbi:MAG: peptide deformylase [Defluviitaleaceae bacterium]|nr:peptide deformylase [Defluviitaleaceae bacterium]